MVGAGTEGRGIIFVTLRNARAAPRGRDRESPLGTTVEARGNHALAVAAVPNGCGDPFSPNRVDVSPTDFARTPGQTDRSDTLPRTVGCVTHPCVVLERLLHGTLEPAWRLD